MTDTTSSGEQGFTLIELLVVILIIGILAAIALPAFLGQRGRGQDATAKSNVRALAGQIEQCWDYDTGYLNCPTALADGTGLPIGPGSGQVRITQATKMGYEVSATSVSGNTFTIVHNIGGQFTRPCTTAGKYGCRGDGTW